LSEAGRQVTYRYSNCVAGFNLPLVLQNGQVNIRILPTEQWQSSKLASGQASLFAVDSIKKMYYIGVDSTGKK